MISDVFCIIIKGELKSEPIYEDGDFIVIKDINPQAPVHALIIPKKHFDQIHAASHEDLDLLGKMMLTAGKAAKILGVDQTGYRLILNQGIDGGQLVPHLHLHLLGGKRLGPKMVK